MVVGTGDSWLPAVGVKHKRQNHIRALWRNSASGMGDKHDTREANTSGATNYCSLKLYAIDLLKKDNDQ